MVRSKTGFNRKAYNHDYCRQPKNMKRMAAYIKKYRAEHPEYAEKERQRRRKPDGHIARRKKKVVYINPPGLKRIDKRLCQETVDKKAMNVFNKALEPPLSIQRLLMRAK